MDFIDQSMESNASVMFQLTCLNLDILGNPIGLCT